VCFSREPHANKIRADVKRTRVGLIVLAIAVLGAAATLLVRAYNAPAGDEHRRVRQFILYLTLSRVDDPVIVLGDSIVEGSTLPRQLCGYPVVDAGLNGASTASDLGNWLAQALGNRRAAAIVVALGINDALVPAPISKQAFEDRYAALLRELSKLTARLFVLGIPAVEARQRMTAEMKNEVMATIEGFNSVLPRLAAQANATFLTLPEMPSPHTIDGVHLNADGYRVWDMAITQGVATTCGQ
jgi:lysophospholipase L1-like esterase